MFQFINENWELILMVALAIYEIIARQIPTEGNWSILHAVMKIVDVVVKNKAKSSETDENGKPRVKRFRVSRRSN